MQEKDEIRIGSYMKRRRGRKIWQRVLSFLICVVVFCTTYALILPAITQEAETFCDYEEHVHDDTCYLIPETAEPELICDQEEIEAHIHTEECYLPAHTHSEECYAGFQVLTCEVAEAEPHAHEDSCYEEQTPVICGMEESEGHLHGDACYVIPEKILSCELAETQPHAHTDTCYTVTGGEQICGLEESEDHSHGASCYAEMVTTLTCGQQETEGHIHTDTCYTSGEPDLVCTTEESVGHSHTEQCYGESQSVLVCTQEETDGHIHSEDCYTEDEPILICQLEEREEAQLSCTVTETEGHIHTEECYLAAETTAEEPELICQREEHSHELSCYSDPTADVESREIWEKSFADAQLTGVWREDVLAIARTQLGYAESTRNYIVLEDGATMKGYTRYGHWYGSRYGDWCAMFASFCLYYAGVEGMPLEAGCPLWIEALSAEEVALYRPVGTYEPQPGDLIFFNTDEDERSDHVGLVYELYTGDDGTERIRTIEGNIGDCVQFITHDRNDPKIIGYGALPEQTLEIITDEPDETQTSLTAGIYTDGSYENPADDSAIITVTGDLPENAEVRAYPVTVETHMIVLCAYDLTAFLPDGMVYEPAEGESLHVHIQSSALNETEDDLIVYYIPDEGGPEAMNTTVTAEGVSFETGHFSTYAVVAVEAAGVNDQDDLKAAFDAGQELIQLTGDFGVYLDDAEGSESGYIDGPITVPEGANITLDLNGHSIRQHGSDAMFSIPQGATLTIIDSQASAETVETVDGAAAANTAVAAEGEEGVTLTYYITKSGVTNSALGATAETLEKHTVTTSGVIYANSQPVFRVDGGTLNIQGGMIYGGSDRAVNQTAGTTNISGGYICGFANSGEGGAVYTAGGTLNISGDGVLAGNEALRGGAVYAKGTAVNMTGGVISGNTSTQATASQGDEVHYGGGGLLLDTSPTVISGGYITNNLVLSPGYYDGGGGILACGTMEVTITGGQITGNEAAGGGGFRTDWQNAVMFHMEGGYICSNIARTSGGGGISVSNQSTGIITGGYINNNTTNSQSDWGGGGIFGSAGSRLYIRNVLVTDNDAGGYGGGVSGSSTGRIYIGSQEGGAVYSNSADGQNMTANSEDWTYAYNSEVFTGNGYQDYFSALNSTVEGAMLGDNAAGWVGSVDGAAVMAGRDDTLMAAYVTGLTANPSDQAQSAAAELAKVYINGNSSYTHGGGILSSGYMIIGEIDRMDLGARMDLKASMEFLGTDASVLAMEEGQFAVTVTDAQTGAVLATATNDTAGQINFKERLPFMEAGTFVYYIQETAGDEAEIAYDTTVYRLTVHVTANQSVFDEVLINGNAVTVHKTQYLLDEITVDKKTDSGAWEQISRNEDPANSDSGAIELQLTSDATFTNVKQDSIEISVVQEWDDVDPSLRPESVTVTLLRNGSQYGNQVTLSAANNWSYTWTQLPVISEDGTIKYSYRVVEDPVAGYVAEYETLTSSAKSGYWVPAASIQEGQRYIIVSPDYQYILTQDATTRDYPFTTGDRSGVTPSSATIDGITYDHAISGDQIPDTGIYSPVRNKANDNERLVFWNLGVSEGSWLLAESDGDNYLRACSSADFASGVKFENGMISMQRQWDPGNEWRVLVYRNDKFTTETPENASAEYQARLYSYICSAVSSSTTIRITNRSAGTVTYELDITKVSGVNNEVVLEGAEFNLLSPENDMPLYFVMNSAGAYTLADASIEGATEILITNGQGKLVLKGLAAATYTLRETKAPDGYQCIEDMTVTLGQADDDGNTSLSLALTIVDELAKYTLPKTGGMGTIPYTTAGLLMIFGSGILLIMAKRRRKGDSAE